MQNRIAAIIAHHNLLSDDAARAAASQHITSHNITSADDISQYLQAQGVAKADADSAAQDIETEIARSRPATAGQVHDLDGRVTDVNRTAGRSALPAWIAAAAAVATLLIILFLGVKSNNLNEVDTSGLAKADQVERLTGAVMVTDEAGNQVGVAELVDTHHTWVASNLVKKSDLANLAKSSDLAGLAKTSDLANLAKSSDLAGLAKTSDLEPIAAQVSDTNAIVNKSLTRLVKRKVTKCVEGKDGKCEPKTVVETSRKALHITDAARTAIRLEKRRDRRLAAAKAKKAAAAKKAKAEAEEKKPEQQAKGKTVRVRVACPEGQNCVEVSKK